MYKYRIALLLILNLAFIGQAHAQRYLPGQKGIQVTGGFVDGFNLGSDFYAGVALSKYTSKTKHWVLGVDYLQKSHGYKDRHIPVSQITCEGGYYVNFFSDASKTVFVSIGASAMAGYETVNWGKSLLFDGATVTSEDNFLYGAAIGLEVETFLTDRLALLFNVRQRLLLGSEINKFHTQVGIGFKIIIN